MNMVFSIWAILKEKKKGNLNLQYAKSSRPQFNTQRFEAHMKFSKCWKQRVYFGCRKFISHFS